MITTLTGNVFLIHPCDEIESYLWEQISGPTATISDPDKISTEVELTAAGVYVFQFTAEDNLGNIASDQVTVTLT